MKFLNWLYNLFKRKRGEQTAVYVKTQEQADAINGFFSIPDDIFMKIAKLTDPSYGRLVTFEFDTSIPEGQKALEYLEVISQFNGNGFADIRVGSNYATMEFKTFEDAEAMRVPWVRYNELLEENAKKASQEKKPKEEA